MSDLLEPPDPELRELFAAEADLSEESASAKQRVLARICAARGYAIPGGGPGDGSSEAGEPTVDPGAGTDPIGGSASAGATVGATASQVVAVGIVTFLAGGIVGATVMQAVTPEPERVEILVPAPAPIEAREPPEGPERAVVPEPETETAGELREGEPREGEPPAPVPVRANRPRVPRPSPPAPAHPEADESLDLRAEAEEEEAPSSRLGRERAIIDVARAAIARRHAETALTALARHGREFPEGSLVEEREALHVIALRQAGQTEESQAAASRFRRRFPGSVFLPALENAR